jgi:hypothetical protein
MPWEAGRVLLILQSKLPILDIFKGNLLNRLKTLWSSNKLFDFNYNRYDSTVRDCLGNLVQFIYGEDGMAGEFLENC